MKRKMYVVALIVAVSMFLGCGGIAPLVQVGAGLAGKGIGDSMSNQQTAYASANKAQGARVKDEQVAEVAVGSNIVKINKYIAAGTFSVVYSAFGKDGKLIEKIVKTLPADDYVTEMRRVAAMSEKEKKDYVCKIFLAKNIDLAAEERPPATELTEERPLKVHLREPQAPTAPSAPKPGDITMPGFAPTIR